MSKGEITIKAGWSDDAPDRVHEQFGTPLTQTERDIYWYEHELAKHDAGFMLLHDDTCILCKVPTPEPVETEESEPEPESYESPDPDAPIPVYKYGECNKIFITFDSLTAGTSKWIEFDKKSWFNEFVLEDGTVAYFLVNKKQKTALNQYRERIKGLTSMAGYSVYQTDLSTQTWYREYLYPLALYLEKNNKKSVWWVGTRKAVDSWEKLRLETLKRNVAFREALEARGD